MRRIEILSAAAASLCLLLAGCGGPSVEAPTSYKTWNAKDGTFQLEYPDGWDAKGGGKQGIQWARIKQGSAQIYVNVSTSDSLLGDIAGSGMGGITDALPGDEEMDEDLAPSKNVHAMNKDRVVEDNSYKNYEEKDGELYKTSLGEAYRAEFTAKSGMSTVHGIRATILGHDKGINVTCHCKEADWETLKPAFIKILDGMKPGERQ